MRFRRGNPQKRMYQTKQFALSLDVANATNVAGFFANDVIIISADTVLGISNTVQGALKRIVVVSIEYHFDFVINAAADVVPVNLMFNYMGLYKDTLDSSSVPDASGDMFLSVDQVSGTTNQQLFPERIIDRRSFSTWWAGNSVLNQPATACWFNPGLCAPRRVRRPLSLTAREALIGRVEAFLPANGGTGQNELQGQLYGVITYRVDL